MVSRTTPPARAGSLARIRGFRLRDILIGVFLVLAVWTLLPRRQQEVRNIDTPGRAMVCFGDSLTAGVGARPGEDIASRLGAALGRAVVNAGVSGDTTSDALARVAADVFVHRPGIVVICLGGNGSASELGGRQAEMVVINEGDKLRNDIKGGSTAGRAGHRPLQAVAAHTENHLEFDPNSRERRHLGSLFRR